MLQLLRDREEGRLRELGAKPLSTAKPRCLRGKSAHWFLVPPPPSTLSTKPPFEEIQRPSFREPHSFSASLPPS